MDNQPTNPNASKLRVLVLSIVSILLLAVAAGWVFHYLHTGKLGISSSKDSLIEIRKNQSTKILQQASGNLRAYLPSGEYIATVSNRISSVRQIVNVKPHQENNYNITVPKMVDAEPVIPFGAYSLWAGTGQIYYADMRDHLLYSVGQNGMPVVADKNITFSKIVWQNEAFGVGANLSGNKLFAIRNGVISPINLPFNSQRLYFDLSKNGHLLLSDGKSIYINSDGSSFNKIFSSDSEVSSLVAGNENILVGVDKNSKGNDDLALFKILDLGGKQIASFETSAYSSAWSPNGKYLAITNDASTIVYDVHFRAIGQLPDANVLALAWLNNNTLAYGRGANLFSYNIDTRSSVQLTALDKNNGVSGIYPDQIGSQIYILDENTDSVGQIYKMLRISPGKDVADYIFGIGLLLPVQLGPCYESYADFTKPLISVLSATPSGLDGCIQSAKNYLIQGGLDVNQLRFYSAS